MLPKKKEKKAAGVIADINASGPPKGLGAIQKQRAKQRAKQSEGISMEDANSGGPPDMSRVYELREKKRKDDEKFKNLRGTLIQRR